MHHLPSEVKAVLYGESAGEIPTDEKSRADLAEVAAIFDGVLPRPHFSVDTHKGFNIIDSTVLKENT
jgi:hypothetical protein